MHKFSAFVFALALPVLAHARAETIHIPDPQIADVQVEIARSGESLLRGSALVSWKRDVGFDSMREIPFKISCKPGFEVTGVKSYRDGIRFQLGGIARDGKLYAEFDFDVTVPTTEHPSPPSPGCDITFVNTHSYRSAGAQLLKAGESSRIVVGDLAFKVTVKKIYDKAPEGSVIDTFVVN